MRDGNEASVASNPREIAVVLKQAHRSCCGALLEFEERNELQYVLEISCSEKHVVNHYTWLLTSHSASVIANKYYRSNAGALKMQTHEGLALYSLIKNSNPDALEVFLSKTKIGKTSNNYII